MRMWKRENYTVKEVPFDFDLHHFDVIKDGKVVANIAPETIEDMEQVIKNLNNGEDINGWEDGLGNTIYIK